MSKKKAFNLFFPALSAKHLWLCALKNYELISAIQCDCATMHEIVVDTRQLQNCHELFTCNYYIKVVLHT